MRAKPNVRAKLDLRARFTVNQRVRVAVIGDRHPPRLGTVRGFSQDGRCVRVQLDDHASVGNFHPKFLTPTPHA